MIVAVNGMAVGGGFEIVLAADLVVAADHARFWLPEASLGLLPDAGSIRLPRMLPPALANEILYAGRRVDAAEALGWGLVNSVVAPVDLMAEARALAARVAAAAPLSVAAIREIRDRTAASAAAGSVRAAPLGRSCGLRGGACLRRRRRRPESLRRGSGTSLAGPLRLPLLAGADPKGWIPPSARRR